MAETTLLPNWATPRRLSILRFVIGGTSAFLLISFGGQIAAAPLTVPALSWAIATTGSTAARVALSIVLVLTLVIVGWFLAYLLIGETQPWILLIPALAGLGAIALARWLSIRSRREGHG